MLHSLTARFRRGGLARNAVLVMGGTIMGQLLVIAATPLLTRIYTPADFGVLAVFTAMVSITGAIANLRYETAIALDPKDEDAAATFMGALVVCALFTLAIAFLLVLFGRRFAELANVPELVPLLWLVPVGTAAMGLYNATNLWVVRRRAYGKVSVSKMVQSLFQIVWQVGAGLLAAGPAGLVAGQALGQGAGVAAFVGGFGREDRAHMRRVRLPDIRRALAKHKRFPLLLTPSLLLNTSAKMLPAVFLAALYGPVVAGQFGLAQRVVLAPVRLLGFGVAQVYLGEAPKLLHSDRQRMLKLFTSTSLHLTWMGVLGMAVVALPAPFLFQHVFGQAFREAGVQLQILAVMYLAQFVIVPVGQTLAMFGRQDLNLYWDMGNMTITLAAFGLGWLTELGPDTTLLIYSIAMSLNYGINWLLSRHVILTGTPAGHGGAAVPAVD